MAELLKFLKSMQVGAQYLSCWYALAPNLYNTKISVIEPPSPPEFRHLLELTKNILNNVLLSLVYIEYYIKTKLHKLR